MLIRKKFQEVFFSFMKFFQKFTLFDFLYKLKLTDKKALEDIRRIVAEDSYTPKDHKELTSRLLVTCYLGTSNSSSDTRQRAAEVAVDIGR